MQDYSLCDTIVYNMNNIQVEFITTVAGLDKVEECLPKSSSNFLPDWWRQVPSDRSKQYIDPEYAGTIKGCPSFSDYFSNGFIIPMWCDTVLQYNKDLNMYSWNTPDAEFQWDIHNQDQFLNYTDFNFLNSKVTSIFKAICPWKIITPPGYSMYQMPLYYHSDNRFSVMPGIIDTDKHHIVNQQVMIMGEDPIFIPRGTPFVQYIPFERKKYKIIQREANIKDLKKINGSKMQIATKFMGSSEYVKNRKK